MGLDIFRLSSAVHVRRPRYCGPGEVIVEEGGFGEDMFFVLRGELSVIVQGMQVATLSAGAFFGEYSALMSTRRAATVVATTFCDFYLLSQSDLHSILFFFPEMKSKVCVRITYEGMKP